MEIRCSFENQLSFEVWPRSTIFFLNFFCFFLFSVEMGSELSLFGSFCEERLR